MPGKRSTNNLTGQALSDGRGIFGTFQTERIKDNSEAVVFTVNDVVDKAGFGKFQIRLILLAGLIWVADVFEIFILSVVGKFIACDWVLYRWQLSLLTSMVFAGMMVGGPVLGKIADVYGRKKSLSVSVILLFIFGAVSAASPSYIWMVILRTCMGFAIPGIGQAVTLSCEYCPTYMRGKAIIYMSYYWSVGSIGIVLMVWIIMEYVGNWRILLFAASLPTLLVIFSLKWYPESARYYLVSNKHEEASKILKKMVHMNGTDFPPGRLIEVSNEVKRGRIQDLLKKGYRRTSLLLWYIWFAIAFSYYGIVFVSPTIIQNGSLYAKIESNTTYLQQMATAVPCGTFTQQNYIDMLWTSAAEFLGLPVLTFLIERMSRRKLLSGSCVISSALIFLLLLDTYKFVILLLIFGARAILTSIFQLNFVMTTEAYPTTFRAVALGVCTCFGKLGSFTVPFVAQGVVIENPVAAISLLGVILFCSGIAAAFLPMETKGAKMIESAK